MPTVNGTPDQITQLVSALIAAQSQMGDAVKDSKNPHFKSTYASLQSVRTAVVPALQANGFALTQLFEPGEDGHVVVVTTLLHRAGGYLESRLAIAALKKDPQAYGSAITYGRRYALSAICGIATDDDDDANAASWPPAQPRQAPQAIPPAVNSATGAPAPAVTVPPALRHKKAVWEEVVRQAGGSPDAARAILSAILPGRTSMEHFSELEVGLVELVMSAAVVCDTPAVVAPTKAKLAQLIGTEKPLEQWTAQHVAAAWAAIRGSVAGVTPPVQPPPAPGPIATFPTPGHSAYGNHNPNF